MKAYNLIYNSKISGTTSIVVKAINAQAVRERYAHFEIIAIQDYIHGSDIGYEAFGK